MKRRESSPFQTESRSVYTVSIWKALGTYIWTKWADGKSTCFLSVVHMTLWHRFGSARSRHEILWFSPDTLLCLQRTEKGYRAYSRLDLWSQSVGWAGCLVSWLFIIPLFLQGLPLPCWCVMTVSLLEHNAVVKWMLSNHLKGLYCSGMYGSDKGSVREVFLTGLLVKSCDRGGPVQSAALLHLRRQWGMEPF